MASEGGYSVGAVLAYLDAHGTRREDGRWLTLNGRTLRDTHRDTFGRWVKAEAANPDFIVPLGRLDEILCIYGIALYELDEWCEVRFGWDCYHDDEEQDPWS